MVGKLDYEVKVIVDAALSLDDPETPNQTLKDAFGATTFEHALMQFLDTRDRDLDQSGLIVRLRVFDGDDENTQRIQVTYKQRFDIDGDDIDGALQRANVDSFDEDFDAQIEWGLNGKVLTISRKKKGPDLEVPLHLPGKDGSREIAIDELTHALRDHYPDLKDRLQHAHVYGPVEGVRWAGSLDGLDVDIEIWKIRRAPDGPEEPLLEVSVKTEDRERAADLQGELTARLDGLIAETQGNKTPMVLDNYPPTD